jgi:AcrR family transcriptional regulator
MPRASTPSTRADAPARPSRLDRETILGAAEAIVGAEGVTALTMRRIGRELGNDPTAVYRHFRNKQELLDMLAERLFDIAPEIDEDVGWREQLRFQMRYGLSRYRAHPDLAMLLAKRPDDTPALQRINDNCLRLLREAGLGVETAARMFHIIENHVVGTGLYYSLCEHGGDPRLNDPPAMRRAYALLGDGLPDAAAAAPHLFPDLDEIYDHGTELILDAIERLARERPAALTTEGPAS